MLEVNLKTWNLIYYVETSQEKSKWQNSARPHCQGVFVEKNVEEHIQKQHFAKFNKAIAQIRNDVICQVCKGHTRPGKKQWHRCLRMHYICQDCVEGRSSCPCGQLISLEYCKMTEEWLKFMEPMKVNCVNTKNGCQETHFENTLEANELEFIHRVIPCPTNEEDSKEKV